jgi:hypothetical protein
MKVEIKITGNGEIPVEPVVENILAAAASSGLTELRADFRYGKVESCPPLFYTGGSDADNSTSTEDAVEMEVNFASIISARLADKHNLDVSDFDGIEPSGQRGFTVGDVQEIIQNA